MTLRLHRRNTVAISAVLGIALMAAGCSSSNTASGDAPGKGKAECSAYEKYGNLSGKKIAVYSPVVAPEDQPYTNSFKKFEECTGAKVNYEGSKEFETQVLVRMKSGNTPDVAFFPQPGLLKTAVEKAPGVLKALPTETQDTIKENFGQQWQDYAAVNGTPYGVPVTANVKSFVWYSPKVFKKLNYTVPQTWDELIKLSDTIAKTGKKPWCAGIESGDGTGWPLTDWVEDVLLRTAGPDTYDKWVKHEIPFNDPQVKTAFDKVGQILKNEKYVNGGFGGVKTIATTKFQDAGLKIVGKGDEPGQCFMHRQASFYASNFPEGTDISENGSAWAFYLPAVDAAKEKPVLVGGDFAAAFNDKPEVKAFMNFIASSDWANAKAQAGKDLNLTGWATANKKADVNLFSGIDKLSVQILQDPKAVTAFDGSDRMPAAVGSDVFWKEATKWIKGQSTEQTVNAIQAAWPKTKASPAVSSSSASSASGSSEASSGPSSARPGPNTNEPVPPVARSASSVMMQ